MAATDTRTLVPLFHHEKGMGRYSRWLHLLLHGILRDCQFGGSCERSDNQADAASLGEKSQV